MQNNDIVHIQIAYNKLLKIFGSRQLGSPNEGHCNWSFNVIYQVIKVRKALILVIFISK